MSLPTSVPGLRSNSRNNLTPGRVLCLAEGQGRNAVFLARRGFEVVAVDMSAAGMARARKLAEENGAQIDTIVADLADFDMGTARWDSIVSIFAHMPPDVRRAVHARVVKALKPGGTFLLEAYTPDQLHTSGTGGPRGEQSDFLMSLDTLREELAGLEFEVARETLRDVNEGIYHHGEGAVVQILARRPQE